MVKCSQCLGFSRAEEVLFKEAHEEVGIGKDHSYAYGNSLDLQVMLEVEGEVIVGEGELGELHKKLNGRVRSGSIC